MLWVNVEFIFFFFPCLFSQFLFICMSAFFYSLTSIYVYSIWLLRKVSGMFFMDIHTQNSHLNNLIRRPFLLISITLVVLYNEQHCGKFFTRKCFLLKYPLHCNEKKVIETAENNNYNKLLNFSLFSELFFLFIFNCSFVLN